MKKFIAVLAALLLLPSLLAAQQFPSPSMNNANVFGRMGFTGPNSAAGAVNIPSATTNGTWFSPTWKNTYFGGPDPGMSVPVYLQGLLRCTTIQDANAYESCFNVDFFNSTGATPPWEALHAYSLGQFVQINGSKVFKVTTAGTSGAAPPSWPASGTVVDGTVTWTFQHDGQFSAKSGMSMSSVSTAGGGNHWLLNPNCVIQSGFKSQLYCMELDVGNYSGFDWTPTAGFPGPQGIWIGGVSDNTSAAAFHVSSQLSLSGKPFFYYGFWCGNALAAGQTCYEDWSNSVAGFHTASFATKTHDIWLQSSSQNGLFLNGTYSNAQIQGSNFQVSPAGGVTAASATINGTTSVTGSVTATGSITSTGGTLATTGNNTRVNMLTMNNRGYRAINTSSGTTLGSLVFQGTTDNFAASFITSFSVNGDGTVSMERLTIATLPTCNGGNAGKMTMISNGIASPTYLQTVSATGAATRKVFCDGANWLYD